MRLSEIKIGAGFTLVEVMVTVGCGSMVLAALVAAGVSLQRSCAAIEAYSVAEGDELRVQDYIAMDCRRATDVSVNYGLWMNSDGTWSWVSDASGALTLIVTVPGYYDASSKNPVAPFFDSNGKVQYGTGGTPGTQTISYYKSGSSFMRQVGTDPSAAYAIATNVADFNVTPADQSTVNGTINCAITFSPRFRNMNPGVDGTTIYSCTFLRNAQARK